MNDYRNLEYDGIKMYKSDFKKEWFNNYLDDEPKVIIEFGSYDCGDSVFYKKCYPNAEVYSIEACPERYKVVESNGNKFQINTFNYAVTDYDGITEFFQVKDPNVMDDENFFGSSGSLNKRTETYNNRFAHVVEQPPISVPCITLESFCIMNKISQIDFMHMDIEGSEHKALDGLKNFRPKLIWMETHLNKEYYGENAYDTDLLITKMKELGYYLVEKTESDSLFKYNNVYGE